MVDLQQYHKQKLFTVRRGPTSFSPALDRNYFTTVTHKTMQYVVLFVTYECAINQVNSTSSTESAQKLQSPLFELATGYTETNQF